MDVRMLSFLVGIFAVLNTIQFFIFEVNQDIYVDYEDMYTIYMDTDSKLVSWIVTYKESINNVLSFITIIVSCFLLYCIHNSNYTGLVLFTVWILIYEFISFALVLLINGVIKDQFEELGELYLIFQISRMFLHFSSLPCIVKHGYALYKDPKIVGKGARHRRSSSLSTVDSWSPVGLGMLYRK